MKNWLWKEFSVLVEKQVGIMLIFFGKSEVF